MSSSPARRLAAALLAIVFFAGSVSLVMAKVGIPVAVVQKLEAIYLTALDEAFSRHTVAARDGTTYVFTGDIEAEWLRDASATMDPYLAMASSDPEIRQTLRGVVPRQARYILLDPYANAFSSNYHVVERKFEVDSLLYPIWFAYRYWRATGDVSIFTPEVGRAFQRVLQVERIEQHHAQRSHYTHPQLANGGRGSPVGYTGMVWTAFRPSDDPVRYHYNIPVNMFAVVVMRNLTDIERSVYHDGRAAENAWGLSLQIQRGIEQYGKVHVDGKEIYAYEVDGLGHVNLMDDANVPSLLSIPYFGYLNASDSVYANTRAWVLSEKNPYFFRGKYAEGIGSPHTPRGYVWPLALVMQALTTTDEDEIERVLGYIAASDVGDHRLHESFNASWPEAYTRADFAWPNALYTELVIGRHNGVVPSAKGGNLF